MGAWLVVLAASLGGAQIGEVASSSAAAVLAPPRLRPIASQDETRWPLAVSLDVTLTLLDQGLPRHPSTAGRSHLGTILAPAIAWRPHPAVRLDLGGIVRVPMSLDFEEDLDALPLAALIVRPLEALDLTLRFGSITPLHGFHPALAHEARLVYGRDLGEHYDRPLPPAGRRNLPGDPRMPTEHGVQVVLQTRWLTADAFLDWQLLETPEHREKFAVGAVLAGGHRRLSISGQLRLDHYGGEKLTRTDPLRSAGLDPTRQDLALAAILRGRPLELSAVALDLAGAAIAARPTLDDAWRGGFELGADVVILEHVTIGWRWWRALGDGLGDLSEAGDPTFRQEETHRASVALRQIIGPLELVTRVDAVFPVGIDAVQYELATWARVRWEWPIPLSLAPRFE